MAYTPLQCPRKGRAIPLSELSRVPRDSGWEGEEFLDHQPYLLTGPSSCDLDPGVASTEFGVWNGEAGAGATRGSSSYSAGAGSGSALFSAAGFVALCHGGPRT